MKPGKTILTVSATAAVIAAVIGGLLLLGSPAQERMRRLDERRVADLRNIENVVKIYWTRHKSLPVSLESLSSEPGVFVKRTDPEAGLPYEYKLLSSKNYELCAHFSHDTAEERNTPYQNFWSHGPDRQCFQLEVQDTK